MDTAKTRELVRAECLKDSNRFGGTFFDQHILVVVRYAGQLAEKLGAGSAEQVCLSNADVLSHIARPIYWCHYLYGVRGFGYVQGLDWLHGRVHDAWANLTPEARELAWAERAAAVEMIEQAAGQC